MFSVIYSRFPTISSYEDGIHESCNFIDYNFAWHSTVVYCLNVCCKACKYLKVTLEYEKLAIIWKVPVRVTRYFSMLSMFVGAK